MAVQSSLRVAPSAMKQYGLLDRGITVSTILRLEIREERKFVQLAENDISTL